MIVIHPACANGEGFYECFTHVLIFAGIPDWQNMLVGFGSDVASVNIGARGLKGYLKKVVPWVLVFWRLAHCLELALKDSLKGTLFSEIDDMLLRLLFSA